MLEFMDVVRRYAATIPGGRTVSSRTSSQGGFSPRRGGFPVEIDIRGPRLGHPGQEPRRQIIDEMQKTGLVTDVDSDYQVGMPEVQVVPDRNRAADLGISMSDIGETVNSAIGGPAGGQVQGQGTALRHPGAPARRTSASGPRTSSGCSCARRRGASCRLRDLVQIQQQPTLQAITRKDRERAITIFANVAPGASQAKAIERSLEIARGAAARRLPGASPRAARQAFQESFDSLLVRPRAGPDRGLHGAGHAVQRLHPPLHGAPGPALQRERRAHRPVARRARA